MKTHIFLGLAWRWLRRDLFGHGQWAIWGWVLALVVAVASFSGVTLFTARLESTLQRDAKAMMGADLLLRHDDPIPQEIINHAKQLGLETSRTLTLTSMAIVPDTPILQSHLIALKAVEAGYPLRGTLRIKTDTQTDAPSQIMRGAPPLGQIWVDAQVLQVLNVSFGQSLALGDKNFRIAGTIDQEPDRGWSFMNLSPRIIMALEDVPATGLVQPASRVTHRLQIAGSSDLVTQFGTWFETIKAQQPTWRSLRHEASSNRPETQETLSRAEQMLRLVALFTAVLSAIAVAVSGWEFASQRLNAAALLRVLGLTQRQLMLVLGLEWLGLTLLAVVLGTLVGYGLQGILLDLLADMVTQHLAPPTWDGLWLGSALGLSLSLGFAAPALLQLAQVPALRVLRRELGQIHWQSGGAAGAGLLALMALLWLAGGQTQTTAMTLAGIAGVALFFALIAGLVWWGLSHLPWAKWGVGLRLAWRLSQGQGLLKATQMASLSLGLMALGFLVLMRWDVMGLWQAPSQTPAPNRFIVNVQPDQNQAFQATLQQAGLREYDWFPMVRARLTHLNGQDVATLPWDGLQAKRMIEREFNLSASATLPAYNTLSEGSWKAHDAQGISVEEGLAKTLRLRLGDTVRFEVGGQPLERKITSIRRLSWASLRVNFFMLLPDPDIISHLPHTFVGSLVMPPDKAGALERQWAQDFGTVTVVDTTQIASTVQTMLTRLMTALQWLFGCALVGGLLILLVTLGASSVQRMTQWVLLRALGATQQQLQRALTFELVLIGGVAGLLSAVAAQGLAMVLARQALEQTLTLNGFFLIGWPILGAILVWGVGSITLWTSGRMTVREVLG